MQARKGRLALTGQARSARKNNLAVRSASTPVVRTRVSCPGLTPLRLGQPPGGVIGSRVRFAHGRAGRKLAGELVERGRG